MSPPSHLGTSLYQPMRPEPTFCHAMTRFRLFCAFWLPLSQGLSEALSLLRLCVELADAIFIAKRGAVPPGDALEVAFPTRRVAANRECPLVPVACSGFSWLQRHLGCAEAHGAAETGFAAGQRER